ncbi:tRNA (adenosine(37)-N6)-threonylcarbamoyltransferase complex ATPase subunit type 1 TsaE [Enteractinococcus coprophilus]|uniref:tRNA (adenosine(37)-N6)-threonylcarbamoyltransferase complex ATPase subunit type 1 TsaE n=1 Tax=Enteractinococcus coprophilus TaxID=1027633 RepID=UPI001FECD14C|nr:tRNA (adenosine(37)-N6)-threonylcarbamoyltransferase complex ATPase subunit type 1 TsaE [Enteractinococcus coprophilus]
MRTEIELTDVAATHRLARSVAHQLHAGDVMILTGELGAGKTTFTQGLASALGITASITSPTFVLARHHKHPGDGLNLVHVDAYRITSADELASLDLESWLDDSVVVVEWGRGTAEALTDAYLDIELIRRGATSDELITDFSDDEVEEPRTAIITGHGQRWEGIQLT